MLQSIRDKSQSWVSILIIGFLIVMFGMWGISYYLSDSVSSVRTLVKINGKPISVNQYREAYGQLRNQNASLINSGKLSIEKLKEMAIKGLVQNELIYQAVLNAGLNANSESIDQYIYQLPFLQQDGKFSETLYKRYLRMQGLTTAGLRDKLKKSLLVDEWRLGVLNSDFILPSELNNYLGLVNQKRHIQYLDIPFSNFTAKTPTSAQIEAYYKSHQTEFMAPERVKLQYLSLKLGPFEKNVRVTTAQAQAYYDENKATYTTPPKRHVAMILLPENNKSIVKTVEAAISKGASFASLAKKYSEDPVSAAKGGDIGWISPRISDLTLAGAVFGLKNVGDVSTAYKTKYGMQIIKLLAEKPSKLKSFSDVKRAIVAHLEQTEAMKKYAAVGNDLANITYENPSSLSQAAKQLKLKMHTTVWFSRQGKESGILSNAAVLKSAFSDNVLDQKNNSDPINLTDKHVLVIRIADHNPKHLKSLAQVRAAIAAKLKLRSQQVQAKAQASKMLSSINAGAKLQGNVKSEDVSAASTNTKFSKAVFNLSRPGKKPVNTIVEMAKSYRVISLSSIAIPSSFDPIMKKELAGLFGQTLGASIYQQFIDYQHQTAKIDYNQKVKESI